MAFEALFGRKPINLFEADLNLQNTLEFYMGSEYQKHVEFFQKIGEIVANKLDEIAEYTDKIGRPKLVKWGTNGKQVDEVWLNPAHRELLLDLYESGVVSRKFNLDAPWHVHFGAGYIINDPGLYCSITVTLATTYTIYKYGDMELKKNFLNHFLTSNREEIWQGATWVTEVQGGSDVGANKTKAVYKNGKWLLNGEKYFTSNVGAELALVTARVEGAKPGAKGISLFLVPKLKDNGEINYKITRLKEKIGTIAVPTGEIVMEDTEAYLIGDKDRGIYYTMEMLTISRLANIVGSAGIARKALVESLNYIEIREAFGKKLKDHPLMMYDILEMIVETEAATSLAFKAVDMFEKAWKAEPPYNMDYHHMRLVTHIAKNRTAEQAVSVAHRGMEVHGGIGFLEEFPYARLIREALVLPIWEGTSNIQALDMLEAIQKKKAHEPFISWMQEKLENLGESQALAKPIFDHLKIIVKSLEKFLKADIDFAFYHAKDLLNIMADALQATLLAIEADWLIEKKQDARKMLIAKLFIDKRLNKSIDRGILSGETWMIEKFSKIIANEPVAPEEIEKILGG